MKLGVFVSGTDTSIGKTVVSSLLVASLRSFGVRTGYFKPIQTGDDQDTDTVASLSGIPLHLLPKPSYQFQKPAAPYRAAADEGQVIQIERVLEQWAGFDDRAWVLEGAGGLLVPLNAKQSNRDLIQLLGLRLLIVSSTRLGTINHTLLTIEAARSSGLTVAGVVLVGDEDLGLESVLTEFSGVPIITRIPKFSPLSPALVQKMASSYFSASSLSLLYE